MLLILHKVTVISNVYNIKFYIIIVYKKSKELLNDIMDKFRIENDSFGEIMVDNLRFFGAQTQRSLENFKIGNEKMPEEVIKALILIKKIMISRALFF